MMPADSGSDKDPASSSDATEQNYRQNHQGSGQNREQSWHGRSGTPTAHDKPVRGGNGENEAGAQADAGQDVEHVSFLRRFGRSVANTQAILAAVGVGTLVVTSIQLGSMQSQLRQMEISNDRVEQSIKEAGRQAGAAEDANKIARTALMASERPWVYPVYELQPNTHAGEPARIIVKIVNSGKTPALNLDYEVVTKFLPSPPASPASENKPRNMGIIIPGRPYEFGLNAPSIELFTTNPSSRITAVQILANIKYKDNSGAPHRTTLCNSINYRDLKFGPCPDGGDDYAD